MGDHDRFPCGRLVSPGTSIQFIVMPQAGHGPQHQYPDLAAKYIVAFIQESK